MISYYRERLANLELLDRAEIVFGQVAVPVGGTRRGGWINCNTRKLAKSAVAQLQGRAGFENLRILKNDGWMIWWGDEFTDSLWEDDIEAGRFFGYKESVLRRF